MLRRSRASFLSVRACAWRSQRAATARQPGKLIASSASIGRDQRLFLTLSSTASSSDRMASAWPGSPWRPLRPSSWRSMRADSCRSVRMTCRPPASRAASDKGMSVPRPAMLVAIMMLPISPARPTSAASSASCLALSTTAGSAARPAPGHLLRRRHRARADQHRHAARMQRATAFAHGRPFVRHGPVHAVRRVDPARLAMRGNADHGRVVDAAQLRPDLGGGARHAGQQQVVLEEALVADALERGARIAEFQAFLVLDHLVQALAPGTVGHDASGELVHHHDLAVAHDVLLIEPVQVQHGQRAQDQLFAPERNAPGRGRAAQARRRCSRPDSVSAARRCSRWIR